MNSSIQCLSNTYELNKFFLDRRYKSLIERSYKNPLGTEGRIVQAWAKLINEMWKGNSQVVRPDLFKRILGQYNVTFEGYGQHDSQECINTILDFMSEDLYKKEKKPYVEMTDAEGKSDEQASLEAWNKHVFRNESIICDLFHGQYKSTLICSDCKRISITFDPYLMLTLPIPITKWETLSAYWIQYDMNNAKYNNYKFIIKIKDSDRVADFRKATAKAYGVEESSFLITWVCDNKLIHIFHNQQSVKDLADQAQGVLLLFEIPEELKPKLPAIEQIKKDDSNYGIDAAWVQVPIHIYRVQTGLLNLPRFIWIRKDWTLKQAHLEFFKYTKDLLVRWYQEIKKEGMSQRSKK